MGKVKPSLWRNEKNSNLTSAQIEMENLEEWIRNFVLSWSPGKLRSILSAARFSRPTTKALQVNPFKVVSGLTVIITCDSWNDYKQLVTKTKQLAYRIRKLDPEVELLMLLSPDETIVELTLVATFERFTIERLLKGTLDSKPQIRTYTHPHRLAATHPYE